MSKAFIKESDGGLDEPDLELEEELEQEKPRGARYITRQGYQALQAELERLWKVERPKVTAEVTAAAALGDRSENAEYIYGKKKLREIDRRVRFLSKRLESLTVVEPSKEQEGKVFFGAWVTIEDEDGVESTYQIVGPDEFDIKARKISLESPMARALLGKAEGDTAIVQRPRGEVEVTIVKIRYGD